MKIEFSEDTRAYLKDQKKFISKDSPARAKKYIINLVDRIEKLLAFPYIGKVNTTYKVEMIREIFIDGYKIIYKIETNMIYVLVIYKQIDLDESTISTK